MPRIIADLRQKVARQCLLMRDNRHVIAMMFVHLSVRLSGTGVHCDHTVNFTLRLRFDSLMFGAP